MTPGRPKVNFLILVTRSQYPVYKKVTALHDPSWSLQSLLGDLFEPRAIAQSLSFHGDLKKYSNKTGVESSINQVSIQN